ncbi:MAG: hypothetical protein HZA54_08300 [Planctomycetes bacterium]|nr:hypothetical protein [Planctomycetota bacterium]
MNPSTPTAEGAGGAAGAGAPEPAGGRLPRWEAGLAGFLLVAGVLFRTWGLGDEGLRVPDEGFHCFWAEAVACNTVGAVYRKPLHAVLLSLPLRALVLTDEVELRPWVFMVPQAVLGIVTVALLYVLARRAWGNAEGVLTLACSIAMPYLLFYHRGAFADGTYLAFQTLGLLLLARALPGALPGAPAAHPGGYALVSGALYAAACFVSEAAALGAGALALALVPLLRHKAITRRALAVVAGAWSAGAGAGLVLLYGIFRVQPWFHDGLYRAYVKDVAGQGFASRLALDHLVYFWNYATPPVLLLAVIGVVVAARRRRPLDVVLLGLLLILLGNGFRLDTWAPRRFVATLLPLTLLAGLGGGAVVDFAARRRARGPDGAADLRPWVTAALALLLPATQLPPAVEIVKLRSAYEAATQALEAEREAGRLGVVLAPMGADLLIPFQIEFGESASPLGALLREPGGAERAEEWLTAARARGFTHLMLDYTFRLELQVGHGLLVPASPTGPADPVGWGQTAFPEVRRFLERNPPWLRLENPAGAYAPTLYENTLVSLPDDPVSRWICLFRLEEIGRHGAQGGK